MTEFSESYKDRRVLVTGGAGFIGSHLVENLLARDACVGILDNLQAGTWANVDRLDSGRVLRVDCDVRDWGTVGGIMSEYRPEIVFHLAANASVPGSVEDPRYDFETNSAGTFAVLDACRGREWLKKVVVVSSGAVYGEPKEFPLFETSSLCPISPYGASKLGGEIESRVFASVYKVPVTIARLFNTYGPRMPRFVIFDFLQKLKASPDRLEILGSGLQVRDLNYVSDAVSGLLTLASYGEVGEAYNIASGRSSSVTEIAEMLVGVLGLKGRTRLEYTGQSWAGDAQRWEVNIDKIRAIGYRPQVSLAEGMDHVIRWYEGAFGRLGLSDHGGGPHSEPLASA